MKKIKDFIHDFLTGPEYKKIREIFLFMLITVMIHFAWRFWERQISYFPIQDWMISAVEFTKRTLFIQTAWMLDHLVHIHYRAEQPVLWFDNTWGLSVNDGCTGFKQIAQFMLLILFFPGSWKNKIWFIPLGMFIVYLTNLFRLLSISLVLNYMPKHSLFIHDNVLRSLFYVVIFVLWLLWVNKFAGKKKEVIQNPA